MIMIKILGAALVVLSCSAAGFEFSARLVKRKNNLQDLKNAVLAMSAEMRFSKRNAASVFKEAAKLIDGEVSRIFNLVGEQMEKTAEDAQSVWQSELAKNEYALNFTKKDIKIVANIFNGLGKSDIYNQQKILEHAVSSVDGLISDALQGYDKNVKIYRSFGILTGIFICVLFI